MLHVSVSDLVSNVKQVSSMASGFLDHTTATVSGTLTEIQGKVVDPIVHAVEQPVANLSNSMALTTHWLKLATYVGGGWLLYTAYEQFFGSPVPSMAKRQLEDIVDTRIDLRNRKRRRY